MRSTCPSCGGPLASDQRYCLNCGHAVDNALEGLRTAVASSPAPDPAPGPSRPRARRAGTFGAMLLAGLAVGILAGGLINPSTGVQAAPLIAVRMPAVAPAAAAATSTAPAQAAEPAGLPAAPPPPTAAVSNPAPAATTPAAQTPSPSPTTTTTPSTTTTTPTKTPKHHHDNPGPKAPIPVKLPKIGHVWIVVLADQSSSALFGAGSPARYLNDTLVPQGTLLSNYHATAHGALADGIALLSGQGPTPELQADCPAFENLTPGSIDPATGQAHGHGCVFPTTVSTLPDQLVANQLSWRAYIAGQGAPGDAATTCRHPAAGVADPTATTSVTSDGYVTRRNPFVYFQSLLAQPACSQADVGLGQLGPDLASNQVPALSWIAPDLCTAGEAAACPAGDATTGPAAADAFLSQWIPQIEATAAYEQDGMIVILSDQAPASGIGADSSACCRKLRYPNTTNPGGPRSPGPGGGKIGALVLSRFAAKGSVDATPSDHYSLLRTLEDVFNLPYLGYAAQRKPFGKTTFPSERGGSSRAGGSGGSRGGNGGSSVST